MKNDVSVNLHEEVQKISGFGCFAGRAYPFFQDAKRKEIARLLFSEEGLRLNILRMEVSPFLNEFSPLPQNLNLDNRYFDSTEWTKLSDEEKEWRAQLWIVLEAKSINSEIKIIASTWSPPPRMKIYKNIYGKGSKWYNLNSLKSECYEEFANYLVNNFLIPLSKVGIEIAAISPQNEPEFPTSRWAGCVWSPWATARFISVLRNKLNEKGLLTKIMGGETSNSATAAFYLSVMRLFKSSTDIVATHGYSFPNGEGQVTYNTNLIPYITKFYADKENYVTEISSTYPYDPSIGNALNFAVSAHKFLTISNINALIFWLGFADRKTNEALIIKSELNEVIITKVFEMLGHFSRYVDDSFQRVAVEFEKSEQLFISAYSKNVNNNKKEITIILINTSLNPISISLHLKGVKIMDPTRWQCVLTDKDHSWQEGEATKKIVKLEVNPAISETLILKLLKNSILTLHNEGIFLEKAN